MHYMYIQFLRFLTFMKVACVRTVYNFMFTHNTIHIIPGPPNSLLNKGKGAWCPQKIRHLQAEIGASKKDSMSVGAIITCHYSLNLL